MTYNFSFRAIFYTIIALLLFVIVGILPVHASSSHNYTCADGLTGAGSAPGCSGSNQFDFIGGPASYADNAIVYPISENTTYYVTYTATGATGSNNFIKFNGDNSVQNYTFSNGTTQEDPVAVGGIGANGSILLRDDDAGYLKDVCIDDDGTSCTAPPPPPPSPGGGGSGIYNVASSSETLATSFINTGTVIFGPIVVLIGGFIALLGLGFGIRKLWQYILGERKYKRMAGYRNSESEWLRNHDN